MLTKHGSIDMETAQSNGQAPASAQTQDFSQGQSQGQGDLPSLDSVLQQFNNAPDGIDQQNPQGQGQQTGQPGQEDPNKTNSDDNRLSEIESIRKQELELLKQRQAFKKEQEEWKRQNEQTQEEVGDFRDILDDLLMSEDEKRSLEEQEDERESFDPDELRKSIREEIMQELTQEREMEKRKSEDERTVSDYLTQAKNFTSESAENYPLLDGLGKHQMMYDAIEQTFNQNAELYGAEKAAEMIPTMEQAAKHVESILANELQSMLKSDVVRGYVQKLVGGSGNSQSFNAHQSKGETNTLTNKGFTQHSVGDSDDKNWTDEQAFEAALAKLGKSSVI